MMADRLGQLLEQLSKPRLPMCARLRFPRVPPPHWMLVEPMLSNHVVNFTGRSDLENRREYRCTCGHLGWTHTPYVTQLTFEIPSKEGS